MEKEIGNKGFSIWLLGDSNPKKWEDILEAPLDPRHPARHNIWTPILDVIQDNVFRKCRSRIDTSSIYIRNAVEDSKIKPHNLLINWDTDLNIKIEELGGILEEFRPSLLLCFGAFSFEFVRRALNQEPLKAFGVWGAKTISNQFNENIKKFNPSLINVLPLLHTSISRGRFFESHNYFSDQVGGNYFEFVGNLIADKLIQFKKELPIWIE